MTSAADPFPAPGSPEELTRFAAIQSRLAARFERFREDPHQPYTAVVVPSQRAAAVLARELGRDGAIAARREDDTTQPGGPRP